MRLADLKSSLSQESRVVKLTITEGFSLGIVSVNQQRDSGLASSQLISIDIQCGLHLSQSTSRFSVGIILASNLDADWLNLLTTQANCVYQPNYFRNHAHVVTCPLICHLVLYARCALQRLLPRPFSPRTNSTIWR